MQPVIAKDTSPADLRYQVLQKNGCIACHSSDGSKLVGPSYMGTWGEMVEVNTGGTKREVMVDEDYIRKSIYDPNADVVVGYSKGLMLSYKDLVSEEEVNQIIEYIKSLNE